MPRVVVSVVDPSPVDLSVVIGLDLAGVALQVDVDGREVGRIYAGWSRSLIGLPDAQLARAAAVETALWLEEGGLVAEDLARVHHVSDRTVSARARRVDDPPLVAGEVVRTWTRGGASGEADDADGSGEEAVDGEGHEVA